MRKIVTTGFVQYTQMDDPAFRDRLEQIYRVRFEYYRVYVNYAQKMRFGRQQVVPLSVVYTPIADSSPMRYYLVAVYLDVPNDHIYSVCKTVTHVN